MSPKIRKSKHSGISLRDTGVTAQGIVRVKSRSYETREGRVMEQERVIPILDLSRKAEKR